MSTLKTTTSNSTAHWQAIDARHHLHPFTDHAALAEKGARVITRGKGVYLWDSQGHKLLDGMAGLWCVQVGYGREELVEAARDAMTELSYYNTFFQTTHPYVAELSERIAGLTPEGCDRVIYANSGSEANDTAIKLIRYYWNLENQPSKKIIISRDKGYHGVTLGAASLSGLTAMHPQWDLPLAGFEKIRAPDVFNQAGDMDPGEFGLLCARALEDKILELGAGNVAAFTAEPIQGAGGVIIPPDSYWPEIQRICAKHDVLLHIDEVICGFGRTGAWFGSQTYDIAPDIMTMAKGLSSGYLPISATVLGERVGRQIANANEEMVHGYTYSGHPVAAAVALANLDLMEKEGLVGRTAGAAGAHFETRIKALEKHPLVGEVRTLGLLAAIELVADKETRTRHEPAGKAGSTCRDHCFEAGLIMRAVSDTMVLSPPLTINTGEIDQLADLAEKAIDLTAESLS